MSVYSDWDVLCTVDLMMYSKYNVVCTVNVTGITMHSFFWERDRDREREVKKFKTFYEKTKILDNFLFFKNNSVLAEPMKLFCKKQQQQKSQDILRSIRYHV